jgi:hypothetical protein
VETSKGKISPVHKSLLCAGFYSSCRPNNMKQQQQQQQQQKQLIALLCAKLLCNAC